MKTALTTLLLLFGMIATASPGNEDVVELKKKAAYYEIKVKLETGEITVEKAQKLWQENLKKIKQEAK
jgi:hypothetical protein